MVLNHLQPLMLGIAASARDNATGLESKFSGMRRASAFLSYPRPGAPSYPATGVRQTWDGAGDSGTARAVVRAGRPGSWAHRACPR